MDAQRTAPRRPFLSAEWRMLAMLNYAVDPALLTPLVPDGTELDSWNGITYVGMVGFLFLNTNLLGAPVPLHRNFEEVNLRFYVRREAPPGETSSGEPELRRGVVFVKEIVPRRAVAAVANFVYNENYVALPMRHYLHYRGRDRSAPDEVHYGWRFQGRWNTLSVAIAGAAMLPAPGSEAEFIAEHYWGYARQRDGGTVEYEVEHVPWEVWEGAASAFHCDVAALYGARFAPFLQTTPLSAFVARGSPVLVHRGRRLPL
ncbi:MAG: DUF2071 domain-containing protein [Candidatus Promineifilaceae bacterium]|nr:DUF2071 domain-containing protein [Candidatus Promineifilaceae bacterium]